MAQENMVTIADFMAVAPVHTVGWHSTDLLAFNRNRVRHRIMEGVEAKWHTHSSSDELFILLDGSLKMDVRSADGEVVTHIINAGQILCVPAGVEHRARAQERATLLVMDAIAE